METKSLIPQSYIDPEFEAYFAQLEQEQLSLVVVQAKYDGLNNKPAGKTYYKIKVLAPIKSVIQKAIDFNYIRNQPVSHIAIVQSIRSDASEKISLLTKEKKGKEEKLSLLKNELTTLKAGLNSYILPKVKYIISSMFGALEGILVFNLLQSASMPALVTYPLAIVTALVSAFGLILGANFISKAESKAEKLKRFMVVILIAFAVAILLGIWRARLFSDVININSQIELSQNLGIVGTFSPLPFIVLSSVAFLIALAFELKHWQSDEEKKKVKRYQEMLDELQRVNHEFNSIEDQIETIKAASNFESGSTLQRQEYASGNEYRLMSLAQQLVNQYERINIDYGTDDQYPGFFAEQVNFGFKLYFTNFFKN